jgi:hypothetical protein
MAPSKRKDHNAFRHREGVPPRGEIILNVGEATWTIEMHSPASLIREGWTSKTLTPGMPIKLTIHPLRDGSNGGQFLIATLPDGRLMDGTVSVTLQTRLQTLRNQAAAADLAAEFLQTQVHSLRDQAADADRDVAERLKGLCGL